MEKEKSSKALTTSLEKLDLNPNPSFNPKSVPLVSSSSSRVRIGRTKPPSLVSLCLGVVGKHLEDIIPDLDEIAISFPADVKIAVAAIARRRKLLNEEIIISLADSSWEILDLCGSDVSDSGLAKLAGICKSLRAVDISWCNKITSASVYELVQQCHSLETLRCGQ